MREYVAYGLRIRSALPLPFPAWNGSRGAARVEVHLGTTPASLPAGAEKRPGWQGMPGRFLMTDKAARYLVADGCRVVVEPLGGSKADVHALLVGPVMAAVLQQRGVTTLHASAVATTAGAVVFLGNRGAGKSSLACALMKLGYPMMADDVTGIFAEEGRVWAVPGYPRMRLLGDCLHSLGAVALESGGSDGKVQVAAESYHSARLPLAACYLLDDGTAPDGGSCMRGAGPSRSPAEGSCMRGAGPSRSPAEGSSMRGAGPSRSPAEGSVAIAPVAAAEAFRWLGRHTYRRRRLRALGKLMAHFQLLSSIADRIPVFDVTRPLPRPDLPMFGADIRAHLASLGAAPAAGN